MDVVINSIFIAEFVIKTVSLGFCLDYHSYLRDPWNKLDCLIVLISAIDMMQEDSSSKLSFIKTIRLLRILRPLRFISHNPSMRVIVNCLLESMQGLVNVFLFILVIW